MAEARQRRLLATLLARFDGAALRVDLPGQPGQPVQPLTMPTAAQTAQWARLQAWCFDGAGAARSPLLRPAQAPQPEQRFSVAVWTAEGTVEGTVEGSADLADPTNLGLIEAFSRHLDGSHQLLAAGGALAGLLLRLRVKVCDVAWWRSRQPTDPWDCGYAVNQPDARAALAQFTPRRATLVVAVDWPQSALVEAVVGLDRASRGFVHPVRWLVVQRAAGANAVGIWPVDIEPVDTKPDDTKPVSLAEQLRSAGLSVTELQPRAAAA